MRGNRCTPPPDGAPRGIQAPPHCCPCHPWCWAPAHPAAQRSPASPPTSQLGVLPASHSEQEMSTFSDTLVANGIPTPGKRRELLQGSRKPPRKAAPRDQLLSVRWQFTRFPQATLLQTAEAATQAHVQRIKAVEGRQKK